VGSPVALVGSHRVRRWLVLGALLVPVLPLSAHAWPTVVLDPGHGGTNTGAAASEGRPLEKRLTLHLAQRTADYLRQWFPEGRVLLTREGDEYLTLNERVKRANGWGADAFLSIHLNASESHGLRGYEVFILSRDASDNEAAGRAIRENQEPRPAAAAGQGASPRVVQAILSDLRQTGAHLGSLRLARAVERGLKQARGAALDRGVRQAPFDVLLGLRMPGALVEVGYLDHPLEGPELATLAVQEQIAVALAAGLGEALLSMREGRDDGAVARVSREGAGQRTSARAKGGAGLRMPVR